MKRSRMPKLLKIGGFSYKIVYPWIFDNEPTYVGLHEGDQKKIKIAKMYMTIDRVWPKIMESLLHEIVHAVDATYCGKVITEDEVNLVSTHFFGVLRDNDLQIHKNKLPEFVKVGGFVYKVRFPYNYVNGEQYTCCSDNERLEFRISPNDNNTNTEDIYSSETLMVNFLYLVLSAIAENCSIIRGFKFGEELGNGGRHFQTLMHGLYQVIVYNDLERILKSDGEMK